MRTNQDVIAVVTGANRGIGLEIVHQLADRGVTAVLTARKADAGATAAATLAGEAGRVDFHPLSVTDEASIRALRDHVASQFGRLDVLVNNAGIITDTEAGGLDVSLATVRETLETNTLAPLRMAQMPLPLLKQSRAGRIVNKRHLLKCEHLRDEKQAAPHTHDDIGDQGDQEQAAHGWLTPGHHQRQNDEECDGHMHRDPELLQGYPRPGLDDRERRGR
jgi:short chain dehydrogenase